MNVDILATTVESLNQSIKLLASDLKGLRTLFEQKALADREKDLSDRVRRACLARSGGTESAFVQREIAEILSEIEQLNNKTSQMHLDELQRNGRGPLVWPDMLLPDLIKIGMALYAIAKLNTLHESLKSKAELNSLVTQATSQ